MAARKQDAKAAHTDLQRLKGRECLVRPIELEKCDAEVVAHLRFRGSKLNCAIEKRGSLLIATELHAEGASRCVGLHVGWVDFDDMQVTVYSLVQAARALGLAMGRSCRCETTPSINTAHTMYKSARFDTRFSAGSMAMDSS